MSKRLGSSILAFLLLAACSPLDSVSTNRKTVDVNVDNMTLAEVQDLVDTGKLEVTEVVHEYEIAGQKVVGFMPTEGVNNLEQLSSKWAKIYMGMKADLLKSLPRDVGVKSQRVVAGTDSMREDFRAALKEDIVPKFNVIRLVGTVNASDVKSISQDLEKLHPKLSSLSVRGKAVEASVDSQDQTQTLETAGAKSWSPTYGWIYSGVSESHPGNRYITNYMWWTRNTFTSSQGYEHDLRLNNQSASALGPGTYLEITQNAGGYPTYTYYATSWPSGSHPYRDTRFGDGSNEIAFSFGMARANQITTGRWHYNYIVERPGRASRDNGKQTNQLMSRRVIGCTSQWCMFGIRGETVQAVPAWNVPLPGRKSWSY